MTYAVLLHPGHARVYLEDAERIALRELEAMAEGAALGETEEVLLGGERYLLLRRDGELSREELKLLARFSGFFALFEEREGWLRPLESPEARLYPEKLNTILKYTGKTNERFTRMLVNLALAACRAGRPRKLLDPLAGKGTTLFEGLTLGLDVVGVEQNGQWFRDCKSYLTRFLREERLKHEVQTARPRTEQGKKTADAFTVTTAGSKEQFRRGEVQTFQLFHGDTGDLRGLVRKGSVQALVSDLPYGVQHAARGKEAVSRSALKLLEEALPGWGETLQAGAGVALAFNEFTTPFRQVAETLERGGFRVLNGEPDYLHRVDQAIRRNVVVARKEHRT